MTLRENSIVTVDKNGRFSLGTRMKGSKFRLREQKNGNILLERVEIVPASETWFFKDRNRMLAMDESMRQSQQGKAVPVSDDELIEL